MAPNELSLLISRTSFKSKMFSGKIEQRRRIGKAMLYGAARKGGRIVQGATIDVLIQIGSPRWDGAAIIGASIARALSSLWSGYSNDEAQQVQDQNAGN